MTTLASILTAPITLPAYAAAILVWLLVWTCMSAWYLRQMGKLFVDCAQTTGEVLRLVLAAQVRVEEQIGSIASRESERGTS